MQELEVMKYYEIDMGKNQRSRVELQHLNIHFGNVEV